MNPPYPLLIGGLGGSGTRVVAGLIQALDIYLGSNLNESLDNLDWPGNIKLLIDPTKSEEEKRMALWPGFKPFTHKMSAEAQALGKSDFFWATKVPGSFYYLPYLAPLFDHMHYIHVIRHGLDMAFSNNTNQLHSWGSFFGITPTDGALPRHQLDYWAQANSYALTQCHALLPGRHLLVRFEDLCTDTENSICRIMDFVKKDESVTPLSALTPLVKSPDTIGRYKHHLQAGLFDQAALEVVKAFGYEVAW